MTLLTSSPVVASLGRLDGALMVFGDGLIPMLRRSEVVASSRLDGNQASLLDLMDSEAGLAVTGPARDVAELRALNEVAARVPETGSLPATWLLEIHGDLMKRLGHPGVGWRTAALWIGASGATRAEARHIPASPEQIPELMQNWQQSLQNEPQSEPLTKLSTGLAALETIHPFTEANARVARLWLQQWLIRFGFLRHPVLLWSSQLQRRGHDARHAIQALRAGNGDPWTPLFISLLQQAAEETTDMVCRAAALRSRHRQTIIAEFGRAVPQALRLADALVAAPMIDIKGVMELTGVTFPAANDLVRRFERAGLLVEVTGNTRNRRFRYAPFVRIFLED